MARGFQIFFALSALAAIVASGFPELYAVGSFARPFATFCAAMLASSLRDSLPRGYRWSVLIGITIALTGDFLAVFPGEQFLGELYCFTLAQIVLLAAFGLQSPPGNRKIAFIAYALVVSPLLAAVYPTLAANFQVPVALCIASTALAAAQSASWMLTDSSRPARYAAVGGAWFMVSTSTLIIDRFRHSIPLHDVIVMGAYWAGMWCVARSVSRTGELQE